MAVNLSPIWGAGAQLLDNSGNVLSGGKIYTYAAGTTTQVATYTSNTGVTANSNPIVLNSAGRVPYEIWLTDGQNYKFVLKDSNDVLIGTWDNLSGINSNFIAFTNEQEIQTATAGQTVFGLTTMQYLPGTNSLSVFVDGVNQYGPGAQYAYEETDSTTVTFASGLHVGAEVKFTSSQIQNAGVADASQISYTYPAVDAVEQNVEERLAQYVSVKDFGAVGDGVTDDTVAFNNAVAYCAANGLCLYAPSTSDYYKLDSNIVITCAFEAGLYRVFGGTGVVSFTTGKVSRIYPEWWGAFPYYNVVSDTGADSTTAFTAASACLTASQVSNNTNILPALCLTGTYKVSDTITFTDSVKIIGDTNAIWVSSPSVVYSGADTTNPTFYFTTTAYGGSVRVEGINFVNKTSTAGAYALSFATNINSVYLNNNHLGGFSANALFATFVSSDDVQILNNVFDVSDADKPVINFDSVSNCVIENNNFFDCVRLLQISTACVNTIFSNNVAYNQNRQNTNSIVLTPTNPNISDILISGNRFKGINNGGEFLIIDNANINITFVNNKIYSVADVIYFLSASANTTITFANNSTPSIGGSIYNSNSVSVSAKILHNNNDTNNVPLINGAILLNESSYFDLGDTTNKPNASIPMNCLNIGENAITGAKSTTSASVDLFSIVNVLTNSAASGILTVQVQLENPGVSLASGTATFFVFVDKSNGTRNANITPIASHYDANISALGASLTASTNNEILAATWTTAYTNYNYSIKATFTNLQSSGSNVVYLIAN